MSTLEWQFADEPVSEDYVEIIGDDLGFKLIVFSITRLPIFIERRRYRFCYQRNLRIVIVDKFSLSLFYLYGHIVSAV